MHAYLLQKVGSNAWIVVTSGHVEGRYARQFLCSFITGPDISVECEKDGKEWRWELRRRKGGWQLDKRALYRTWDH